MDAAFEMTDEMVGDLIYQNGDIATDSGLKTACLISLFTDARAFNTRGWWGGEIGSKLWTFENEKRMPENLLKAREYAENSLEWMIEEGIAAAVDVKTEYDAKGRMLIRIDIQKPDRTSAKYAFLWGGNNAV